LRAILTFIYIKSLFRIKFLNLSYFILLYNFLFYFFKIITNI